MSNNEDAREWYEIPLGSYKRISSGVWLLRVPGGWIVSASHNEWAVFVPFNNEFMEDIID